MPDASGYAKTETHDLTTPRGRLLYLRDVVIPGIPIEQLDMDETDCGSYACMAGWACRDKTFLAAAATFGVARVGDLFGWDDDGAVGLRFLGITVEQADHLFMPVSYSGYAAWINAGGDKRCNGIPLTPTHAELTAHINDVLEGRLK